jgi:hypothetical protein
VSPNVSFAMNSAINRQANGLCCSHAVCKVDDIRVAVRDLEGLGFAVQWGSAPERAHNALVWFEAGPFLEFFELPRVAAFLRWPFGLLYGSAAGDRLLRWAQAPEGWCDWALETSDTALFRTRAVLCEQGVPVSRVIKGKRTRPDGNLVRYQFLATRPACLPFVVSAYSPPQRPVRIVHPNGARAVARVRLGIAPRDWELFRRLVPNDPWLAAEPNADTRVLGVELAGLNRPLDQARLHGAVITQELPE